jgi:hypothetical protein
MLSLHVQDKNFLLWVLYGFLIKKLDLVDNTIIVCETKVYGVIDQSLFYIDLTIHYVQNFENLI